MKLQTSSKFEYVFILVMAISIIFSIVNYWRTLEYEIAFFVSTIILTQYFYRHLKFNNLMEIEEKEARIKAQATTSMIMSILICLMLGFSYIFKTAFILETWVLIGIILLVAEIVLLGLYILNGLRY